MHLGRGQKAKQNQAAKSSWGRFSVTLTCRSMQDDTFPKDLFPSAWKIGSSGLSFLRTVPTRPENTLGKKWRWEMCSEIFWISVFQVILFFKSSLRPWKEFIQRYLVVVETFSQRMWWLLLWGCYIWEKSTIKNRATKTLPGKNCRFKIQYYSKHILLQTPAKTTRNIHIASAWGPLPASQPCKMPQPPKNPSERPSFFLDVSLPYNGFQTLDKLEKNPWVSNQKSISGLEKKTQVYPAHQNSTILFHALQLVYINT